MTGEIRATIFASGAGSNFEAIMDHHDTLGCEIVALICDQPQAAVIQKAQDKGVPAYVFDVTTYASREIYEQELLKVLKMLEIDWIFLAGYMRIIGKTLLDVYEGQIVNIHPSLLPQFPGLDAIGQAIKAGVEKTGVTIHYIDEGIDTGPIIVQEELMIAPDDTKETLQRKIQAIEHQLYPKTIKQLMKQTIVTS